MTKYEDDNLWYKATDSWIMLTQLGKKYKLTIFHWFKGYIDAFYPYKPADTDGVSLKIEDDDKLLRAFNDYPSIVKAIISEDDVYDFLQNLTSDKFPELSKEFSKFLGKDISGGDIREICKEWETNND